MTKFECANDDKMHVYLYGLIRNQNKYRCTRWRLFIFFELSINCVWKILRIMRYCCVKECKNNSTSEGIVLFSFPSDEALRKKWLDFVDRRNVDGSPWLPKDGSRICSSHFAPQEVNLKQRRLRGTAAPSNGLATATAGNKIW